MFVGLKSVQTKDSSGPKIEKVSLKPSPFAAVKAQLKGSPEKEVRRPRRNSSLALSLCLRTPPPSSHQIPLGRQHRGRQGNAHPF